MERKPQPVPAELKQVFEDAVGEIQQEQKPSAARQHSAIVQRRMPIASKSRIIDEKRALSDAAKALAQLWNISPHPAR